MDIIIRPFNDKLDAGFLFCTLPKGIYHSSFYPILSGKDLFFEFSYDYLKYLINNAEITIACTREDYNFIIGYSILMGHSLEWIYVKNNYRNQGIAKLLIKNKKINQVNENNLTNLGHKIMENHKDKLVSKKEEPINEQNSTEAN